MLAINELRNHVEGTKMKRQIKTKERSFTLAVSRLVQRNLRPRATPQFSIHTSDIKWPMRSCCHTACLKLTHLLLSSKFYLFLLSFFPYHSYLQFPFHHCKFRAHFNHRNRFGHLRRQLYKSEFRMNCNIGFRSGRYVHFSAI